VFCIRSNFHVCIMAILICKSDLQPLVLERPGGSRPKRAWAHTKSLYRLSRDSQKLIRGCSDEMCYTSTISSLASMDEEMDHDHYW
jgi:hypothetical protein